MKRNKTYSTGLIQNFKVKIIEIHELLSKGGLYRLDWFVYLPPTVNFIHIRNACSGPSPRKILNNLDVNPK